MRDVEGGGGGQRGIFNSHTHVEPKCMPRLVITFHFDFATISVSQCRKTTQKKRESLFETLISSKLSRRSV